MTTYVSIVLGVLLLSTGVCHHLQVYMQVWTFILSDTKFKTNFTHSAGPTAHAPEVTVDKVQIVCVDAKMFDAEAGAS